MALISYRRHETCQRPFKIVSKSRRGANCSTFDKGNLSQKLIRALSGVTNDIKPVPV